MMSHALLTKRILAKASHYTTTIVFSLLAIIGVEYLIMTFTPFPMDDAHLILLSSLVSFFALVRAILALNVDLSTKRSAKWRLLLAFIFWSVVSFGAGFYASYSAVTIIDASVFPVVSFLAQVWKSYLLLFITCVNFIGATFLFHRIINAIQVDTIEWFKRGFGGDGDPPAANLAPVAKKILLGLTAQLVLNVIIYMYGSPDAFFQALAGYAREILAIVGITLS